MPFPHYSQYDAMDCGPTCLRMVAKYYGKHYKLDTLRDRSFITREGVSMLGISRAAESIGFRTMGVKISFEQLKTEAPLPAIVHWNQNHFVVVYKITGRKGNEIIHVADPAGVCRSVAVAGERANGVAHCGRVEGPAVLRLP